MKHESSTDGATLQTFRGKVGDDPCFNRLRPRLEKIACRMLRSHAEAEDVVQDTWLRWNAAAGQNIENTEAWLVAVTTRLSVDRLRAIKSHRDCCSVRWAQEWQATACPTTPEEIYERVNDVSRAYLVLLERLTPGARGAFLMHEVFDIDYDQIAKLLCKTQSACRQSVRRAKILLRGERQKMSVPQEVHQHLFEIFVQALERAGLAEISALLVEDVRLMNHTDEPMTRQDGVPTDVRCYAVGQQSNRHEAT